ncbi:MAG TPA: hypothetical protein VFS56_00860, partial [Gemmatimonadaceae bacterium]|nr:hypothetical protein [Gemmatimonadaceae bacterium]
MIRYALLWPIVLATSACIPDALVRGIAAGNPGCLYSVSRTDRTVALTLDDGPDSTTTPELLDV